MGTPSALRVQMNLNETLKQFEAVEANLAKLDDLWKQIKKLLPAFDEIQVGEEERYLQLCRSFEHVLKQMPKVDGHELKYLLDRPEDIFRGKIDTLEAEEFVHRVGLDIEIHRQGEALDDYRFRVESKRRALARQSVQDLSAQIDSLLQDLQCAARKRKHNASMPKAKWQQLTASFKSIDALLGKSLGRPTRWGDMARHLSFGVKTDYQDIVARDWPDVREWLERALYGESDPIPIVATDLGELVNSNPHGPVATELKWDVLSPGDFERLIFNLIDQTKGYVNPKWLTDTNAPDRGRDLSVERFLDDALTESRKERVMLACKHTGKVNVKTVSELQAQMKLWEPPVVHELIIVTTGRFTTDAVDYVEKHNRSPASMRISMWPNSHLERLLARRPELIAKFRLRS